MARTSLLGQIDDRFDGWWYRSGHSSAFMEFKPFIKKKLRDGGMLGSATMTSHHRALLHLPSTAQGGQLGQMGTDPKKADDAIETPPLSSTSKDVVPKQ